MALLKRIALLVCIFKLCASFSLEPAWTKNEAHVYPKPVRAVPSLDSSQEIVLLKNLADYFLTCLISAYPNSYLDSELVTADTLLKREDYEGALMHLELASRIGPDDINFDGKKAAVYRAMGRPGLAIPYLESAAALRGKAEIRRELAEAYKENGEFTKALAEYEKLLSTDTNPTWVRQQIISLTRQKLLAAESLSQPRSSSVAENFKNPDSLLLIPRESRCAIVEKESQTLFLYRNSSRGYELEKTYACSTGARQGEKVTQGDERTPEGIYIPGSVLTRPQLPEIYGKMAITLNYPNAFDRMEGKSGGGIWLHATNELIRPYLPNKTRGCVVVSNEDIEELSRLIVLNQTPLVIVPRIRYRTDAERNMQLDELKDFLSEWRGYWESKQVDRYISTYSKRFRNANQSVNDWKAYKESVFSRAGKITLGVDLLSAVQDGQYAVLTFRQDYHSDRLISRGIKRLYVVHESGWKIVAEEIAP